MRLYTLIPCFVFAAGGYILYGWGAQTEGHWIIISIGIGAMTSHQVGACTIATAYAIDCFPGVSLLADSISRRRPTIPGIWRASRCTGYVLLNGQFCLLVLCPAIYRSSRLWLDYDFGIMLLLSVLAAVPLVLFGKRWRVAKGPKYYRFLDEVGD